MACVGRRNDRSRDREYLVCTLVQIAPGTHIEVAGDTQHMKHAKLLCTRITWGCDKVYKGVPRSFLREAFRTDKRGKDLVFTQREEREFAESTILTEITE